MAGATLSSLPVEIILHIFSFLGPHHVTQLHLVSRRFRSLGRDANLWRPRSLDDSPFLVVMERCRKLSLPDLGEHRDSLRHAAASLNDGASAGSDLSTSQPTAVQVRAQLGKEHVRIMTNWDPTYPTEKVSWYNEYIQRYGPVAVNWYQEPRICDGAEAMTVEARGLALYHPGRRYPEDHDDGRVLALSPLDDGTVCIWDVDGSTGKRGSIIAKSREGILLADGPGSTSGRRSTRIDSNAVECVSVDNQHNRAYFAVQSHLMEVDLDRLSVVGHEIFPWSITALSHVTPTVPLTVGTVHGIHLHDHRSRAQHAPAAVEGIDEFDRVPCQSNAKHGLSSLFTDEPLPPYTALSQPNPLSILHLQRPGMEVDISDDIYVAGSFSNILHYDRRKFPAILGSIYSGARLCGMTSLPYPFSAQDSELRRGGLLSVDQVRQSKSKAGRTLVACGEYNTKGSLEVYGLAPSSDSPASNARARLPGGLQESTLKNRQTASNSKILSVINHGSRFAFSDGSGYVRWFERDGFTEIRRHKIGHSVGPQERSLFASMPDSREIARKLLPTQNAGRDGGRVKNDIVFWTGERLGSLSFSARPGFTAEDFEENMQETTEEMERKREEELYSERMRTALQRQADEVRFVKELGLGSRA